MKKKVSILIEGGVIRHANQRAAEEGRPLSGAIQDALISYLSEKILDPQKRQKAYQLFCEQPMRISREQFREIMEADAYE
jgi:hypothetical protein